MINLNDFKKNGRFSQGGEEGIITELYKYIEPTGYVVEFGAADGFFCSNTAHLWTRGGVEALLIESDPDLFSSLQQTVKKYSKVKVIQALVENIEDFTKRPADILSVDIDGMDFDICYQLKTKHQIVIVEYNPTVPPHVDMRPIRPLQGSSAKTLTELMIARGYTLVACTKTNLFFLLGDHTKKFESNLKVLFDYSSLNYTVTTFDGYHDHFGEWNFGFGTPANLHLSGRPEEYSMSVDTSTKEWIRQMVAIEESRDA